MLISNKKSTLLKSIVMILTLVMVVCICLTACADEEARKKIDELESSALTDEQAKKIAQDAAQKAKDELKKEYDAQIAQLLEDYLKADKVAEAIEGYLKTDAGIAEIRAAIDAYLETVGNKIDEKIAGLQNEEQVKALIEAALANYSETVSGLIDEYFEAWKNVDMDAIQAATDRLTELYDLVETSHWVAEDKAALDTYFEENIDSVWNMLDLIKITSTEELDKIVSDYEAEIAKYESLEQAAAKINEKIDTLGIDLNGVLTDAFVEKVVAANKFGYVIVTVEDDYCYIDGANLGKVGKYTREDPSMTLYKDFDFVLMNIGADQNLVMIIQQDPSDPYNVPYLNMIPAVAVIAPNFADEATMTEINDMIAALVEKYGEDNTFIRSEVPAVPDDTRTEEDESVPAYFVYNPACPIVNFAYFQDYSNMVANVKAAGQDYIDSVAALVERGGENYANVTADADTWVEYLAAEEAYKIYEDSRFDNVVEGVSEARDAFDAFKAQIQVAKDAASAAQKEAWAQEYTDALNGYMELYKQKIIAVVIPEAHLMAQLYPNDPLFGHAVSVDESAELAAWVNEFCTNYATTMPYDHEDYGTIGDADQRNQALSALLAEYNANMAKLDDIVAADGYVKTMLDEIDAKWWFAEIVSEKVNAIVGLKEGYASWAATDEADTGDIYDLVTAYVTEQSKRVSEFVLDEESETPHLDAIAAFENIQSEISAELTALLKYYAGSSATAAGGTHAASSTYISYLDEMVNALETKYNALCTEYSTVTDAEYYAAKKVILDRDYEAVKASLEAVTRDVTFAASNTKIDNAYADAAAVLQTDVYEMKIDKHMIETEKVLTAVLNDEYRNGAGAEIFAEYWEGMLEIIKTYQTETIPSRTFGKYYVSTGDAEADMLNAYNAAIAAIDADLMNAKNDLARYAFDQKLADFMAETKESVDAYHAATIEGHEDTYELFAAIKSQIDEALKDIRLPDVESSLNFLEAYSDLYESTIEDVEDKVTAYKNLLNVAIEKTEELVNAKAAALETLETENEALMEVYEALDYKEILVNNYNKLVRDINDLKIIKDETVNITGITAQCAEKIAYINSYISMYNSDLNAYKVLMDAYKTRMDDLEGVKAQLMEVFDNYFAEYAKDVRNDGDIPMIFEISSPLYNSMVEAKNQIANIKLNMVKNASAEDDADKYYTADEAYANAANYLAPAEGETGSEIYNIINTIKDETGKTTYVANILRHLRRIFNDPRPDVEGA